MRMKSLTKSIGALALFVAVTVHAQPNPTGPTPAPAATPANGTVQAKLSVPEMLERSAVFEIRISDDARKMQHLQDVARKEKDVVKLTCVNDRLVELKAQQNMYDKTKQEFQASTNAGNADAARPSYDELSRIAEEVQKLRAAAEACIGLPELYKQESDIQVTHPDFPDDPTTTDPFDDPAFDQVEPPGYASPFI